MAETPLTFERLELKYLVDEAQAARIRADLEGLCDADREGGASYGLMSLYLDSPALAFHRAKLENAHDRFKLRVRAYEGGGPVFLEVKRKTGDVIRKKRVAVDADGWEDAAAGYGAPLGGGARSQAILDEFSRLQALTGAVPRLLVHYLREAWASNVDRYARVTFDRAIRVQDVSSFTLEGEPDAWHPVDGPSLGVGTTSPVILELKCESRLPSWMVALVRRHELVHTAFSKYSNGIATTSRAVCGWPDAHDLADLGEA